MFKNKSTSTFIIILIVFIISGISILAEKTTPDDFLYGVKIFANEKAAGMFALSKEDKIEWKERLIERRLEEIQKLVSRDNFDKITRIDVENKIKNLINEFNISLNELASEKNESINSSDLSIRLQASLLAYQNILEKLSEEKNININTKTETKKIISFLGEYQDKIKSDHEDLELNIGVNSQNVSETSSTAKDSASTLTKQTAAESLLNSTKLLYQKEKVNWKESIKNQIDTKLGEAETSLQEGKTLVISLDYANATEKFQLVINKVNETKLLMLSNIIRRDIEEEDDIHYEDFEEGD